jgi:hypothetical protein
MFFPFNNSFLTRNNCLIFTCWWILVDIDGYWPIRANATRFCSPTGKKGVVYTGKNILTIGRYHMTRPEPASAARTLKR